jgi:hypothetical protein
VGRAAHRLVRRGRDHRHPVYSNYGTAVEDGDVPYREIEIEYPPGALPAFVVPALLSDDESGFRTVFEAMMALFGVVTVLLSAVTLRGLRASPRRTAGVLALIATFPLLLGSVVLTRFDLYPTAFVAAAIAALVHGATGSASASSARRRGEALSRRARARCGRLRLARRGAARR